MYEILFNSKVTKYFDRVKQWVYDRSLQNRENKCRAYIFPDIYEQLVTDINNNNDILQHVYNCEN
jgi:hypothetical protein